MTTAKTLRLYFDSIVHKQFNLHSNEANVFRFFHQYHAKGLLARAEAATISGAVECRFPFVDEDLIEYSFMHIPYDLKLKWKDYSSRMEAASLRAEDYSERLDIPKYLLRQIAYDFLPQQVVERPKIGFPVPLNNWFDFLMQLAADILSSAYWIRNDKLDELFIELRNNPRAGQILWMLINVELFRQKYFCKTWQW